MRIEESCFFIDWHKWNICSFNALMNNLLLLDRCCCGVLHFCYFVFTVCRYSLQYTYWLHLVSFLRFFFFLALNNRVRVLCYFLIMIFMILLFGRVFEGFSIFSDSFFFSNLTNTNNRHCDQCCVTNSMNSM